MLISFNGVLTDADDKIFSSKSRIYKYGDGFFESIKVIHKKPQLFDLHYQRILRASTLFHLPLQEKWTKQFFEDQIELLCLKNGWVHARCRLIFYRESEGFYAPERNKCGFLIEMSESLGNYPINDKGLRLGEYGLILKPSNFLSFFKPLSAIQYVLAGIHASENGYDSVILYNEQGNIAEAYNANIFLINGDEIITPGLNQYCLDGVMRHFIIEKLKHLGYIIKEAEVSVDDLIYADEVFISNATRGITWIESFGNKNYDFKMTYKLHAELFGI
ncbi:MAG: aminotransferase class IV [Bacteroidia bacterium]|nr:aminotransferase class IV [Bacteroidia bacterium]